MRVLMVNRPDTFSVPGGDTVQMTQTASCLRGLGISVDLTTVDELNGIAKYDIVHVFNWEQLQPTKRCWYSLGRKRPMIALSPIFSLQTGHWYRKARQTKLQWRVVSHFLGDDRGGRLYDSWQEQKLRHSSVGREVRDCFDFPSLLLPNSATELEYARSIAGIDSSIKSRCAIIPNGVNRTLYQSAKPANLELLSELANKRFVLQVSRIQSEKNQAGLIEALMQDDIPIVFVGQESPYEPDYVELCRSLAARRGNVHFLGARGPEEIPGIFARAAVHVLPSWRESQGLVSLEAAAAGSGVVTTLIGGGRDYFGNRVHYCDPKSAASIRSAVVAALASPPNSDLRKHVLSNFTWNNAAELTLTAYRRALGLDNREDTCTTHSSLSLS